MSWWNYALSVPKLAGRARVSYKVRALPEATFRHLLPFLSLLLRARSNYRLRGSVGLVVTRGGRHPRQLVHSLPAGLSAGGQLLGPCAGRAGGVGATTRGSWSRRAQGLLRGLRTEELSFLAWLLWIKVSRRKNHQLSGRSLSPVGVAYMCG